MRKKGFTLIELLVVIAIIGILASIVIVNVNEARKRARDGRRVADLEGMQTALELYYDRNKQYPATATFEGYPSVSPTGYLCWGYKVHDACWTGSGTVLANFLTPTYFQTMPFDPSLIDTTNFSTTERCAAGTTAKTYLYWVNSQTNAQKYQLITSLESTSGNTTMPLAGCSFGNYIIKGGNW